MLVKLGKGSWSFLKFKDNLNFKVGDQLHVSIKAYKNKIYWFFFLLHLLERLSLALRVTVNFGHGLLGYSV